MKIALLSTNDNLGGAAVVTQRLQDALRAEGVEARMIVAHKRSDNPLVNSLGGWKQTGAFLAERVEIFAANGFSRDRLFKVSTARFGVDIARHPSVADADAVIINWTCQGFLSLHGLEAICRTGKPVIWTMHDLWAATGICHLPEQCDRFKGDNGRCGNCPLLGSGAWSGDLSRSFWKKKKQIYDRWPIKFVTVSEWQRQQAAASALLAGRKIDVIPHAFPVEDYQTEPSPEFSLPGINLRKRLIVMGAARLDDPIKGLPMAIASLNLFNKHYPDLASGVQAVFFGGLRDQNALDKLELPHTYAGPLTGDKLRNLYASASVVLSTSDFETMGATLMEGMAAGAVPVTFGIGGQTDIVTDSVNGYIAAYRDPTSVASLIARALASPFQRKAQHASVASRFSSSVVARRYLALAGDRP